MYNPSYQSMLKMSEPPVKTSVNSLQANYRTDYAMFSPETAPLCWCLKATADNFNVLTVLNSLQENVFQIGQLKTGK